MKAHPPLTPGRVVYLLYHDPLARIRRSIRQGGPWQQHLDRRGREEMEAAACRLSPPHFPADEPSLELHLLTGRAFVFQSLFCLASFANGAQRNLAPILLDDGTLTPALTEKCRAVFPQTRIITHAESQARIEDQLPAARFPFLHGRWAHDPLIQKLLAVHLGSTGWKLVLDSDLLFFRRPDFLLRWLAAPRQPLHMIDVTESYGYPRPLLEELAGGPMPGRVNSGLCGLRSESLDWTEIESWCARLIRGHGTHYLLEQTLTALLMAREACAIAPEADYLTRPTREEAAHPRAVMHHYVHDSKRWYFRQAWRHALGFPAILSEIEG